MKKSEFLSKLNKKLKTNSYEECDKTISYYDEMISDEIENGKTEEEAVLAMGNIDDIVLELTGSVINNNEEKKTSKQILMLVLSVFALPFLIVAFSLIVTFYILMYVMLLCIYTCDAALLIFGAGCIIFGSINGGTYQYVMFIIGCGLMASSLAIFLVKPLIMLTKTILSFTKCSIKSFESICKNMIESIKRK